MHGQNHIKFVLWHNLPGGFVVTQEKPQYIQRPGSSYNQVLPKAGQQARSIQSALSL